MSRKGRRSKKLRRMENGKPYKLSVRNNNWRKGMNSKNNPSSTPGK